MTEPQTTFAYRNCVINLYPDGKGDWWAKITFPKGVQVKQKTQPSSYGHTIAIAKGYVDSILGGTWP